MACETSDLIYFHNVHYFTCSRALYLLQDFFKFQASTGNPINQYLEANRTKRVWSVPKLRYSTPSPSKMLSSSNFSEKQCTKPSLALNPYYHEMIKHVNC